MLGLIHCPVNRTDLQLVIAKVLGVEGLSTRRVATEKRGKCRKEAEGAA